MERIDLAIGWSWEFDEPFVRALEEACQHRRRLRTYQITPANVDEVLHQLERRELSFGLYLDRAFDVDERFEAIGRLLCTRDGQLVNDYDRTVHSIDKATMHLEFITAGLHVPFTIIISPYADAETLELTLEDLAHLGRPFIIKPANTTGGGMGVVTGAETLLDVLETRREFEADKYLLQEKIYPKEINGRRCWFRCFYVYDKIFLCWWDDLTHIYAEVTPDEEHYYRLKPLRKIMKTIGRISGLKFFSSEIALRTSTAYEPSNFVVVDYVNDMCDMRTQLVAHDGIPNPLLDRIVDRLALAAAKVSRLS